MAKTYSIAELPEISRQIRIGIIESIYSAGSGHPGGALGIADFLAVLYFLEMNTDPSNTTSPDRDRFVLSPAHMVPGLYSTLAQRGFMPIEELKTLRKFGSRLQGHAFRDLSIGVETTGGSLGQGLSIACGMSLSSRMDSSPGERGFNTYCLISDGELDEGQTWEALMFAAREKFDNLLIFLDRNLIQLSDMTANIMPLEPIRDKLESFNFHVLEVDGHSHSEIKFSIEKAKLTPSRTSIIILNTVAGKGVSFMEGKAEWHGKSPNEKQYTQALKDLRI